AAPQREDLHNGPVALDGEADHVDRPDRVALDRLPLDEMPNREQPVAVAGRVLETLLRGRRLHLLLELALDRPRIAGEELDHLHVRDAVGKLPDLGAAVGRLLEVRAHPRAQRLGLADVEDLSVGAPEQVDAGLRREARETFLHTILHGPGYRSRGSCEG